MITKLCKSNIPTIYIYMGLTTSKFHPCQHFLTITPTKGRVFVCLFVLIFGSFEAECWLIGAVAHIYSIDRKMKHFFQLTGCPCLCLDLPFLPFEGLEGMPWASPHALRGRHGALVSPLLHRSQHPQGETCPLPPQDTRIPVQPRGDPVST